MLKLRSLAILAGALIAPILIVHGTTQAQGGSGLQLSPTRTELSANVGEQKQFTITLKNITQTKLAAQVTLNDFTSDDETGTPKILVDPNAKTAYSLSKMVRGLSNVQLNPGETKEIRAVVDIPAGTVPGAYYGAIRYEVIPQGTSDAERQIALNASVAHLLLVEVPGDIVQQIQIEKLSVLKNDQDKGSSFFTNKPAKTSVKIKNLGNGFARPFGKVTVNNPLGKQVSSADVNNTDPRGIVLPNSSRSYTNDTSGASLPGRYTVTASVAYGDGAEVITYKTNFWYLPIWFIALISLFFIVAISIISFVVYRVRKAKRIVR